MVTANLEISCNLEEEEGLLIQENANHPFDLKSDRLLAKHFIPHLMLVLGGRTKHLENSVNVELS